MSEFSVSRSRVCVFWGLWTQNISLSLWGPKFPVVFCRRRLVERTDPFVCVCVCLYWNNIQKKERERERPQKRDRVVVQGITALKTTPTLNVRALERERCFERRRFQSFWTTRFSYFSKRYTGHACRFAFKFFLSFWIENLI